MSVKGKRFPLSLSAVVDKPAKREAQPASSAGKRVATPQTATQNAAQHALRGSSGTTIGSSVFDAAPRTSAAPVVERATPLVSDAVRQAMVQRIAKQGVRDQMVLAAMQAVPRHLFVDEAMASQAYIDSALPIGHHQTISQPYIVARMIEVLRNNGDLNNVLEIGTGCGYQAAVLSLLAKDVYSIERIKPLHELAKANLRPMRIANIRLHYGDGMLGFPQVAPFDGIILAAAGIEIPQSLLEQMRIGGRLVAPVGTRNQVLQLVIRHSKFEWSTETLEGCHFVPLRAGTV